jgi:hypothetical protein
MVAHARRTDPDTSHEAAASITIDTMSKSQFAVLTVIRAFGPLADHELDATYEKLRARGDEGLPMQSPSGIRTRRRELYDAGLIEPAGETTTPTGRRALTWRAAEPTLF